LWDLCVNSKYKVFSTMCLSMCPNFKILKKIEQVEFILKILGGCRYLGWKLAHLESTFQSTLKKTYTPCITMILLWRKKHQETFINSPKIQRGVVLEFQTK